MKPRDRAFTLIETLVAVMLIALLAALLLGTIGRVQQGAKRTECGSNLRQLGAAFAMYASDYQGFTPRAAEWHDDRPIWLGTVPRYLGLPTTFQWAELPSFRVLQCPSHPTPGIPSAYVLNAFAFETRPEWKPSPPVRSNGLRNPAALAWLVEASDQFGPARYAPFDAIFYEVYHVVYHPDHILTRLSFARHVGRTSNVLYADGHVSQVQRPIELDRFDDGIRRR